MDSANIINLNIFLPALMFSVLSKESFQIQNYQILAFSGAIIILGSGVIAWVIAKVLDINIKTFVPPMMFNNTGNVGLPIAVLAFGEIALGAVVVLFAIEMLLHFTFGAYILSKNSNFLPVFRSPILIATLAGIGINLIDFQLWLPATQMIDLLGQAAIPLLLFTLGTRLIGINFNDWKIGILGAILCPISGLVMVLILVQFFDFETLHYQLIILFSVLPPAVLNHVMAEKYQQQPETVASIVMIGNIGSLFVLPIALYYVLLIN
ncbi:MAG: AEC family transporter [Gammaproteobacteria bacterium]|nr:AEC family transporter [Gammaproteobacteria bacterium]